MELNVSNTNGKQIINNVISLRVRIATVAKTAPSDSEPVSPINTLAGYPLNIRKPASVPTNIKQNIPISSCPISSDIKANATNDIADRPPAKPSNPSVKLTALLNPTSNNKINIPYPHFKSIYIPNVE